MSNTNRHEDVFDEDPDNIESLLTPPPVTRSFPHMSYTFTLHPSIPRTTDKYDHLGRNTSTQERRQELEPWVKVSRVKFSKD